MAGNVRFILGRAGTGKSQVIQELILGFLREEPLGPPVYLLVPAQATFAHERHFALAAGVEGYARLRVVSFENLGEDVIAECGGDALTKVTSVGRQMLLGHLLRVHADRLEYFKPVARQLGLVRELDQTFGEFERAGQSTSGLRSALENLHAEAEAPELAALLEKTRDLALLGDAYRTALGADRLDATRRLEHVLSNVENCRSLREARLFVDGFFRFSAFERKLLAGVCELVAETHIALTLDPRELDHTFDVADLFHETATTWRQLTAEMNKSAIRLEKAIELESSRRFRSPALACIERDWSMPRPSTGAGVDAPAVRLVEAPDVRAEADAAARQVRQWADEGIRLRDMAVLCRDLPTIQPILEASFQEHNLPFFTDRRRSAAHHPLVRCVRSLLRVAQHGWPHEAVMDLCKCGLAGMSLDDADVLENYAIEHRIRGSAAWTSQAPWTYGSAAAHDLEEGCAPIDEDSRRADQARLRLARGIVPLADSLRGEPRPVREHLTALWRCMESFGVGPRLADRIEEATAVGRMEEAAEHVQAWEELTGLCDQAIELLGSEVVEGEDFVSTLEYGLDLLDLAIAPPRADEVVIGDVDRTRLIACRAAVVMGLNDGTFPASNVGSTVLGDEERRLLRRNNVDVEPDGQSRQFAERFLAYRALTTPSERLTLSRSTADAEGRPTTESPYWLHVRTLLGIEPVRLKRESADTPDGIGTPRQLAGVLMRWARSGASPNSPAAGLYHFLAAHEELDDGLGRIRRLAWRALAYTNQAKLSEQTARKLFGDKGLYTSVSRLEAFASCPFRHYASHILGLRERDDGENVTPRDLGTVYHNVLERLVRQCIVKNLQFIDKASITPEQIRDMTREIGEELRGRVMLSSARNEYLLKRIETMLHGIVAGQQAVLRRGRFQPLRTELRFGEGKGAELGPLELGTPKGRRVRLYGQIDRVDYAPGSGYAAVIDYKHTGRLLRLDEVTQGLSLQLLLYLLVLQRNGASLADPAPQPAAGLYVTLLRGLQSQKHPADAAEPEAPAFDLRVKPRGVIDVDALPHLDAEYVNSDTPWGFSDAYSVALNKSGGLYRSDGNDLVPAGVFDALLAKVEEQVVRLADELMDGSIAVRPYKMGTDTPCPRCEFRPVCRFDSGQDPYMQLTPKRKWHVVSELGGTVGPPNGEEGE